MERVFALIFIFQPAYASPDTVRQPHGVLMAQLGDVVTLECYTSSSERPSIWTWFKDTPVHRLQAVATVWDKTLTLHGEFNSSRFKVEHEERRCSLTLSHVRLTDVASYVCGTWLHVNGSPAWHFGGGTMLLPKSPNTTHVTQQPAASVPAQPGDSVTLQCTVDSGSCAGEHSVYWFTLASGESQPGVIYSHGGRSAECEKSPEAGSVPQSCVYSLPVNHADTYYCAVAACGHMVLGTITVLDRKDADMGALHITVPLLAALVTSAIVNVGLLVMLRRARRLTAGNKLLVNNKEGDERQGNAGVLDQDPEADMMHYAALSFASKRSKNTRKVEPSVVYAGVRELR